MRVAASLVAILTLVLAAGAEPGRAAEGPGSADGEG